MNIRDFQPATLLMRDVIGNVHAEVVTQTNPLQRPHRYLVLRGYLSRALGWLHTLSKVDDRFEFQAIASAMRGLLEGAIDCLWVHRDPKIDGTVLAIAEWEDSASVKWGDLILEYYKRFPPLPPEFQRIAAWSTSREVATIKAKRLARWPGGHPQRWTGMNLPSLARDLDAKPACKDCQLVKLEELYVEQGYSLNLLVHGSAFAGLHITSADLDHHCASMLLYAWQLASIVGLVSAHEVFNRSAYARAKLAIEKALHDACGVFGKVTGVGVPPAAPPT